MSNPNSLIFPHSHFPHSHFPHSLHKSVSETFLMAFWPWPTSQSQLLLRTDQKFSFQGISCRTYSLGLTTWVQNHSDSAASDTYLGDSYILCILYLPSDCMRVLRHHHEFQECPIAHIASSTWIHDSLKMTAITWMECLVSSCFF